MKFDADNQEKPKSPQHEVRKRFLFLAAIALVLIAIVVWITLAVIEANDLEPFGEVAQAIFKTGFLFA